VQMVLHCPRCLSERGEVIYYASRQTLCAVCKNPDLFPVGALVSDMEPTTVDFILADLAASSWLKSALLAALSRDPVDAANDADVLAAILARRAREILESTEPLRDSPQQKVSGGA
jgi:hypothetical protein